MKYEDYLSERMQDANAIVIEGKILKSPWENLVIIIPCFCVHDTLDSPCRCDDWTKIIINLDDIIREPETTKRKSTTGEDIVRLKVSSTANVIVEKARSTNAANLESMIYRGGVDDCYASPSNCDYSRQDRVKFSPSKHCLDFELRSAFVCLATSRSKPEIHEHIRRVVHTVYQMKISNGYDPGPVVAYSSKGGIWSSIKSAISDAIDAVGDFVSDNQEVICAGNAGIPAGILAGLAVLKGTDPATAIANGTIIADQLFDTCMGD